MHRCVFLLRDSLGFSNERKRTEIDSLKYRWTILECIRKQSSPKYNDPDTLTLVMNECSHKRGNGENKTMCLPLNYFIHQRKIEREKIRASNMFASSSSLSLALLPRIGDNEEEMHATKNNQQNNFTLSLSVVPEHHCASCW